MSDTKAPSWRHRLEATGLDLALRGLGALPIDRASALSGALARVIGPWLKAHRVAERNLTRAFPEKSPTEIAAILSGMWDNLGRVAGELPHLAEILPGTARTELIGGEHLGPLREAGASVIFISAHFGNWEILSAGALLYGIDTVQINRAANNPLAEAVIERMRAPVGGRRVPKGPQAARAMLAALKNRVSLAMLLDQKMNDGVEVPFFGRPAWTPSAAVELALRLNLDLVPARVERLDGAHFRLTVEPPFRLTSTGDRAADVYAGLVRINQILEGWIRARPELWFWVHRRWQD